MLFMDYAILGENWSRSIGFKFFFQHGQGEERWRIDNVCSESQEVP